MNTLVCKPISYGDPPVPSEKANCETCGQEVWITPASRRAAGKNAKIICISCAQNIIQGIETGMVIIPLSNTQMEELGP